MLLISFRNPHCYLLQQLAARGDNSETSWVEIKNFPGPVLELSNLEQQRLSSSIFSVSTSPASLQTLPDMQLFSTYFTEGSPYLSLCGSKFPLADKRLHRVKSMSIGFHAILSQVGFVCCGFVFWGFFGGGGKHGESYKIQPMLKKRKKIFLIISG